MYDIRLYILGQSAVYQKAVDQLRAFLDRETDGRYSLEVVDLFTEPQRAADDEVFATPTLVKRSPTPVKKMIGDIADRDTILKVLNIHRN